MRTVAPENNSHKQQYGRVRVKIRDRVKVIALGSGLGLGLVTL